MKDFPIRPGSRAYSYVRFSSKKQRDGDSLRRQKELVAKFVAKHELELDPHTYHDLGISAWTGDNATKGALSLFLEAVEQGAVAKGSLLLIEALDRLSRQDLDDAILLFISIINKGITIVTLGDGFVYSREVIKNNAGALHMSIAYLAGANKESDNKSQRLREVNAQKRERGDVRLNNLPSWLTHKNGKLIILEDRAAVIRWMFERSIIGDGTPTIAKKLNGGEDVPEVLLRPSPLGRLYVPPFVAAEYWTSGLVSSYLRNVAVAGTLHQKKRLHDPVPNHYPAIVEQDVFDRSRAQAASRLHKVPGRGSRIANLFGGITFCECGQKMTVVSNGDYMRCKKSLSSAGCDAPRAPIKAIEEIILRHFNVQHRHVYGYSEHDSPDLSIALRDKASAQERRVENLLEMAASAGFSASLSDKLQSEQRKLEKVRSDLAAYIRPTPTNELVDDLIRWKSGCEPDERLRLRTAVLRILSKVVVRKETLEVVLKSSGLIKRYRYVDVTFARSGAVRRMRYEPAAQEKTGRLANGRFINENKTRSKSGD